MKLMKTPKSLELALTDKCNLRCKYCSHFTSARNTGEDLPAEEWLKFFEELGRLAVLSVTLEGAETFCREDIKELIEGIVRNRMRFNILSNGTLITDEVAQFLARTGRCNGVQVSIDGAIATTHDAMRGEGNFLRAVEGINLLRKHRVPVQSRVTITRANVGKLEDIAEFLLEKMRFGSFGTNSASYMGLCRRNSEEVQLNIEEHSMAMEKLLRLNKKYDARINAAAGPLANAKSWLKMEEARLQGREGLPRRGYLAACNGPMMKMAVRADGAMVPCIQISHIELGRINKDSLKEVWQNHPELKRFRERRNIPLSSFEFCRGCEYINYCTGNCPALSYTISGDAYHPSPDACLRRFLDEGGRLPRRELLTV